MLDLKVQIQKNDDSNLIPKIKLPDILPRQELSNPQLINISQELFNNNGVLQIDNLLPKKFVRNLSRSFYNTYQTYFDDGEYTDALEVGDRRRMITLEVKDEFNNSDLYADPFLLGLMSKVLGEDFILGSYGVVIALPGSEHQHVHRDHPSLFGNEEIDARLPSFAVTVVIPLVDLTEATGSTRVWKQSHRQPRSQREFRMSGSDVPYMSTGSCYLMDYQLVHGGTANVSQAVRPILYLIYYRSWFREIVNFEKQDRINISAAEYSKVPDRYKFLFAGLTISDKDKLKVVDNREIATPLLSEGKFTEVDAYNQEQRLTRLAQKVLPEYGLAKYRLGLINHRENTTFSLDIPRTVTQTEGSSPYLLNRYLLRVHRGNYLSANAVKSELQWLQALRRDLDLPVPEPVPNLCGELVTVAETSDVPEPRICSVTKWLYAEKGQAIDIKSIGRLMGQLHDHAENWQPPANFERPRWDWNGLFGSGAGYSIDRGDQIWELTPQPYRNLFRKVGDRFKEVTETLGEDSSQLGLIHGDLCPGNLLSANNRVRPIDFADCGYGYWVQDIAMFLSYFARNPQVPTYLTQLLDGYQQVRPLPTTQLPYIDTFIATQLVTLALWRINRSQDHPYFRSILDYCLREAAEHARWFLDNCPRPTTPQLTY